MQTNGNHAEVQHISLSTEDAGLAERFDRQMRIQGFNQQRLASATVAVAGCGTLGSAVAHFLAAAGVGLKKYGGQIDLFDMDRLERANRLMTGVRDTDLDRPKVQVVAERLQELFPDVYAVGHYMNIIYGLGTTRFAQYDAVALCFDNLMARVHMNRLGELWAPLVCVPLVEGGLDGMSWAVSTYLPGTSACYE
jgi:molybdopterin/thiamine biosynthesis adenylyltransferase